MRAQIHHTYCMLSHTHSSNMSTKGGEKMIAVPLLLPTDFGERIRGDESKKGVIPGRAQRQTAKRGIKIWLIYNNPVHDQMTHACKMLTVVQTGRKVGQVCTNTTQWKS